MNFRLSAEKRRFLVNFFNYGLFQASKYIVPLITVPYIIHVLGIEKFGIISLAQGIANYIRVGVDYGWNILGVQYIARASTDRSQQRHIVSTILAQQLLLSAIGFLLLALATLVFPKLQRYWLVFWVAYGLVPGNMLLSSWFYVGIQKVKYLNALFLFSRFLYVALVLLMLKPLGHMIWVPAFNSLSLLVGGCISLWIIRNRFSLAPFQTNLTSIKQYFKEGWPIFISYFSTNFYRNSNIIILSFFANDYALGLYSAAEKIIKVLQGTFMPLSQTIYPYLSKISVQSREQAIHMVKKVTFYMGLLALLAVGVLNFLAPWIYRLITGYTVQEGYRLLQIGSGVIFFGVLNFVVGVMFMTNFGLKHLFARGVVVTGIVGIASCFILSYLWQAPGAMASFTLSEAFLLGLLLTMIKKLK